jgi:hypothetical protein
MTLINDYQKGWALRYLREAKAELAAAKKIPYMASSLILEAAKKAQAAVYFSLGDPASVEVIVHQSMLKKEPLNDPVLRCLVNIERMVQEVAYVPEPEREKAFGQADELIRLASDIVRLFAGEKTD